MNKKIKILIGLLAAIIALIALFAMPSGVHAADGWDFLNSVFTTSGNQGLSFTDYQPIENLTLSEDGINPTLTQNDSIRGFVVQIMNFALTFLGLFAVIMIIYGGFLYLGSAGETDKAEKGRKVIQYSVIGIIIILGAYAFVNTIIKGASTGEETTGTNTGQLGASSNVGGSFNASASQVYSSAQGIPGRFVFFVESVEEVKSIVLDAQKSTLNTPPTAGSSVNDMTRENIYLQNVSSFLNTLRQKLLNMRSRISSFSSAYIRINEIINEIEILSDQLANSFQANNAPGTDYFAPWVEFKNNLIDPNENNTKSLAHILSAVKDNYVAEVIGKIIEVQAINQELFGIQAAEEGRISDMYTGMVNAYGINLSNLNSSGASGQYCSMTSGGFLGAVCALNINSSATEIDQAGRLLLTALTRQVELSKAIATLEAVQVRLRASTVNGNAPLIVNFNVLETVDPAGGTILGSNIIWDLEGLTTVGGTSVATRDTNIVNCEIPSGNEDEDFFGTVFRKCTFKRPGVYTAKVLVKSNDPNRFVPGQSTITIKVDPPNTQLNLNINLPGQEPINVMSYYEDMGIIKTDRDYVAVTLEEAKNIVFDASQTRDSGNITFNWDFGDTTTSGSGATQPHPYNAVGRYNVTVTMIDRIGNIDRKTFVLDVRNVAARINLTPSDEGFINQNIQFDGTASTTTSGSIRAYQWQISRLTGNQEAINIGEKASQSRFTHQFTEGGRYSATLTVTDATDSISTTQEFTVRSQPPTAVMGFEPQTPSTPSTIVFDGTRSFDPDGTDELSYLWTITPDSQGGRRWEWVNGSIFSETIDSAKPIIKFKERGDYQVTLKVTDPSTIGGDLSEESGQVSETITIDNVLDLRWDDTQNVTSVIGTDGLAQLNFSFHSDNAVAYRVDFGDGEREDGEIRGSKTVSHTYEKAGKYIVRITAYDAQDDDVTLERRFFVGDGKVPIAKAKIFLNDQELIGDEEIITVTRRDILYFDASDSRNVDGTGRNLTYSWNFGNTVTSSRRETTHSYQELSPADPGYYIVTLRVSDTDDPSKFTTDTLYIKVETKPPTFASIQATPASANLTTPVSVEMRAMDARDPDGTITQYKWWYYSLSNPEEPLGLQITSTPSTTLTIGTNGIEGQNVTYGFGLEITDSDGIKVLSEDILRPAQIPQITVTNGPNALPTSQFTVSSNNVFVGDKVVFSSRSTDPDGKVIKYIWDFEGDGFFNNAPTNSATVEHIYEKRNINGYNVRLKVIDDKGGEATSDFVKIYVDSLSKKPTAAFTFEAVAGSEGRRIQFNNNSTSDVDSGAQIIRYEWDFDNNSNHPGADSDGDGIKNNDVDSTSKDPSRLYTRNGTYVVSLKVTDNQGNSSVVTTPVSIPLTDAPVSDFTYRVVDDRIAFINSSTPSATSKSEITSYIWDFDIYADSDNDGIPDNDYDSLLRNPTHTYPVADTYPVKLTVYDAQGFSSQIVKSVNAGPPDFDPTATESNPLIPYFTSTPAASSDGIIYLTGTNTQVTFDFRGSQGEIARYIFDKNINADTDGDGDPTNDIDYQTILPGTYTAHFSRTTSQIELKFKVVDTRGREEFILQKIVFR
ncbi:hypothetical protein CVV38_02655 [Candidatus Peregrinibacteria bacterium HGW-Peregrinibacteria-1]|jgi:PKD repeat protein|nr:MAG: hypothetical protein CVV38_02655 [Candidatus Peregrinibacteria bacterium HGW-Peregrinibacteria-1]